MSKQPKTLGEVLQFLMVQNKEYLLAQKGKPPIARCLDCKRDIQAWEMCATCPKCEDQKVCYKCVDKHDHINLHDLLMNPTVKFPTEALPN